MNDTNQATTSRCPAALTVLYDGADPRHRNVVLLTKEDEFRERIFPNWDMELVKAEDISTVLEDAMHAAVDPKKKSTLFNMLQELSKSPLGCITPDLAGPFKGDSGSNG